MKRFLMQIEILLQNKIALFFQMTLIIVMVLVVLFTYIARVQIRQISYYNDTALVPGTMVVDFFDSQKTVVTEELIQKVSQRIERPIERLLVRSETSILKNFKNSIPVDVIQISEVKPIEAEINGRWPSQKNEILLSSSNEENDSYLTYEVGDMLQYIDRETEESIELEVVGILEDYFPYNPNSIFYTLPETFDAVSEPTFRRLYFEIDYQVNNPSVEYEKWIMSQLHAIFELPDDSRDATTTTRFQGNPEYYIRPNQEEGLKESEMVYEDDYIKNTMISQYSLMALIGMSVLFLGTSWYRYLKSRQTTMMLFLKGMTKANIVFYRILIMYCITMTAIVVGLLIFRMTYQPFVVAIQNSLYKPYYTEAYYIKTAVSRYIDIAKITTIFLMLTIGGLMAITALEFVFGGMFNPIHQYFKTIGEEKE